MKTLLTFAFVFMLLNTRAQNIFHENFENPDSVIATGNSLWAQCTQAQTSGLYCDSVSTTDSSFLTTIPFSTLGSFRVVLAFNHVITNEMSGEVIDVSTDGGITWATLGNNEYMGSSWSGADFSTASYNNWWPGMSNPLSIDNSKWHTERFDLSAICSNQANVLVRFKYYGTPLILGGWFVDDITVSGFPYAITSSISCNNDGTATMTPYFGSGSYTYLWNSNPVQTAQTAINLAPGFYTCTVSDGIISYTDSIEVKPPFKVTSSVINPSCGMNNGSISISVTGGISPYNFTWSNGAMGSQQTGLAGGTYWVIITDANGCFVTKTFVLDCGFNSVNLNLTTTPSQCDSATGTATVVNFIGGVPSFTYSWNTTPVQTTQTATGLTANSYYTVTVKDANGDSAIAGVYIPFDHIVTASVTYTPTQCAGFTGTATGNASGGVAPYTYQWSTSPVQTTQTATGLGNTNYTVTVTDDHGCTDDITLFIPNTAGMTAGTTTTPETCNQLNGTATVNVYNATPPVTYLWNTTPPQTTATATGLFNGSYTVTVTDSLGCVLVKSAYVQQVSNMVLNVIANGGLCNCATGTIAVNGGTPPYSYLWSNGDTTQNTSCLAYGWQHITVTDSTGCSQYKHFFVNFPANCFIDVEGYVYADINRNCIKDANEYGIANVPMELKSNNYNYTTLTNNTGKYSFRAFADVYGLTQYPPPLWGHYCPLPNPDTINVAPGTLVTHDIADTTELYFDDAELWSCYSTPNTRGFNNSHYAQVRNSGTTLLSGTISIKLDPAVTYSSAYPGGASYNLATNTVTWNYINLIPGEIRYFTARTIIPPSTPLGTIILDTSFVTPIVTDLFPLNNKCYSRAYVFGSYDPNDKMALPNGNVHKDSLWHTYIINFQNTGSSPAIRVIVEDTLDAGLDFTTLSDIISSHAFVLDTSSLPLVRFVFNNINLPDSGYYEPGSHGFVTFRIKHLPGLSAGTVIANTAYIYFDFNSAVITNTVQTTLVVPTSVKTITVNNTQVNVFPNPVNNELNIITSLKQTMLLEIFDVAGKVLIKKQIQATSKVALKHISPGMYVYRLTAANGEFFTGKIVKE